jgi:probable biosynthetic protein (TIGR04099 family)
MTIAVQYPIAFSGKVDTVCAEKTRQNRNLEPRSDSIGTDRALAEPSCTEALIRLGMPQLSLRGLSEQWLLKELGHRHWQMLAEKSGRSRPDFKDEAGDTVYAAFCAVSIRDAAFGALREHDELLISSDIARVSRTQFTSTHRLGVQGVPLGTVELASVFVKRHRPGQNRSIARVAVDGFAPLLGRKGAHVTELASTFRAGQWTEHFGFNRLAPKVLGRAIFRPSPSRDFNGAGFLYFPCFAGFTDETEWALFGDAFPHLTTVARDVIYYGNIEVGDRLAVEVLGARSESNRFLHWCRITRAGDDARLADVFTERMTEPRR